MKPHKDGDGGGGFLSGLKCSMCKLVMITVQSLLKHGKTGSDIAQALSNACTELQIQDKRVCTYIVKEFQVSEARLFTVCMFVGVSLFVY